MCHFFECASEIGCNLVCDDIESSSIDSKLESPGLLVEPPSLVKAGHLNSAQEVSQMENHEGLINTHLATSNSLALPLFDKQVVTGAKELMNENFVEEACIEEHSTHNSNEEAERLKVIDHISEGESGFFHEFLTGSPLSAVENNDSTSPVVSRELGDLISADVDQMADERLSPGNIEGPSFSGNDVLGSNKTDVDQVSHDNHDSKSNEYMMLHKNNSSQEIHQETVPICQKLSLVGGSGPNSSSISIQVSPIVLEREDMKDVSEYTLLSPAETATRREEKGWSSDEAASSVSGMALTREDQNSGTMSCCLNKESGLLCHQNIQVSVINSDVVEEGLSVSILKHDGNGVVSQTDELEYGLNKAEDSSSTHTSEKCLRPILTVKPPPHAIPFSDEWLAAMEAAGEGILALKSGAVQNSPPNKSLPEPSPWSPVKRKSNHVVGPFDCTKFSKVVVLPPPPSDSSSGE